MKSDLDARPVFVQKESTIKGHFLICYSTYVRVINYIIKQYNRLDRGSGFVNMLGDWLDYVKHAKLLDYDIKSDFILFPKKLRIEHDRMAVEYSKRKPEINESRISAMTDAINLKFKFEADGYVIRAPNSVKEIKDEGSTLNHCVGGYYIDNMAAGSTVLLFIRRSDEPDVPFFTLEFKNGAVSHCRGNRNCNITPAVQKFVDKWIAKKVKLKKRM
jgi:hypothetical protein